MPLDFMHDPFAGLTRPKNFMDPLSSFPRNDLIHNDPMLHRRNFFDPLEDIDYVNHLLGSMNSFNKPRKL